MTAQFHRFAREELLEGAAFAPTYGNTLMGLACHKPFDPADNYVITYYAPQPRAVLQIVDPDDPDRLVEYGITYYAPQPRAVLQIVDPDDPDRLVEYGDRGRVRLTTLTREFFMPGFLERDEAIRARPIAKYPWDGVADVRPFGQLETMVVEGVY
jgi:hypothetical protein